MSRAIKIESGVPMPEPAQGGVTKYPLRKMKVGDSFFVRRGKVCAPKSIRTSAAYIALSIPNFRVTVRTQPKGWRVWRIA